MRAIDDGILKQLFALADRSVWELLKQAEAADTIKIKVPPPSEPESIEAYDPIKFRISSCDAIDESYLFQRALEFRWTFRLDYGKRWWRRTGSSKILSFSATSSEPRIAQYAPRAGKLTAEVRILNSNGDSVRYEGRLAFDKPGALCVSGPTRQPRTGCKEDEPVLYGRDLCVREEPGKQKPRSCRAQELARSRAQENVRQKKSIYRTQVRIGETDKHYF